MDFGHSPDAGTTDMVFDPARKVSVPMLRLSNSVASQGSNPGSADFVYGADGNRVLQVVSTSSGGTSARTVYVGMGGTGKSLYERTTIGTATTTGTVEHVHFIYAGDAHAGNAFALRVLTPDGSATPVVSGERPHQG